MAVNFKALSAKRRLERAPRAPKAAGPKLWPWALGGALLGVLLAALYFAPATWLAWGVARSTQGKVVLADAQGRVWQGSARLLLVPGGQEAVLLPQRLRWTAALQGGGLGLSMRPECCASQPVQVQFKPGWSMHTVDVRQLNMRLPANLLEGLGTPFNTLGFEGQLALQAEHLQLRLQGGQMAVQGLATLDLLQLSSSLSALPQLGSYQVAIRGGARTEIELATLEGALQMSGQGHWGGGSGFRFQGEAKAAPGYEDSLANILNVIGRRQGQISRIQL